MFFVFCFFFFFNDTATTEIYTLSLHDALPISAKVLPGVDTRRLLSALVDKIGEPLTEKRLCKITVTDLKTGLSSLDGEEDGEDTAIGMELLKLEIGRAHV